MDCLFCKIIAGEIPCNKVFENEKLIAFKDIAPKAPVHVLIVPKEHIESAAELSGREDISGEVFNTVAYLAKELKIENGFRVVTNCGEDGRQSVKHLHFHLLAGKALSENM